jgi:tRNA dimethylallyltransferase
MMPGWEQVLEVDPARPVLIAGPTASGKSALALRLARAQGRAVVNADALQVWSCWRVLTARPSPDDEAAAPHLLYGHVPPGAAYSVGHWLREVAPLLTRRPAPVIVGGTGLYLSALTEGLADIPPVPQAVRAEADDRLNRLGPEALLAELDAATAGRIDRRNPARIQRAWEVQRATGRGLADWQARTGAPILPAAQALCLRIECGRDWLAARIDTRFEAMIAAGAVDEVRAMLPRWDAAAPWARAIGAAEIADYLQGYRSLSDTISAAQALSRQYAKRQRTWLRRRMAGWIAMPPDAA